MSLDTSYRPKIFDDVLGQETTSKILRHFLRTKTGFQQSYLFAGSHGCGKTTLARILARGLLCEDITETGDPCDKCSSCKSMLERGTADGFVEMDAATNSGKEDILRIVEDSGYSTFSGRRRVYLLDESHQLSPAALNGLLKSMEETVPNSEDKKLVCLFCTTEPEKMKETIASRCAPTFRVRPVAPTLIADRLALVCNQEHLQYDLNVLVLIAEYFESHIRDCLKAVEAVAKLGPITFETVSSYLGLGRNDKYIDILDTLENNPKDSLDLLNTLQSEVSPTTIYIKLAEVCFLAFRTTLGQAEIPSYWNKAKLTQLGTKYGSRLLTFMHTFSSRPAKPVFSMVACDLLMLAVPQPSIIQPIVNSYIPLNLNEPTSGINLAGTKKVSEIRTVQDGGVYIDSRAQAPIQIVTKEEVAPKEDDYLDHDTFALILKKRMEELAKK